MGWVCRPGSTSMKSCAPVILYLGRSDERMARGRGARYRRSKDMLPTKEFRFRAEGTPSRRDTLIVAQPPKSFRAGLAFLKSYPSRPVRHSQDDEKRNGTIDQCWQSLSVRETKSRTFLSS